MQGSYRLMLAMMVVIHHLAKDYAWFAGNFAVLGFYALSAYLITGAIERNYGTSWSDIRRFAINRALRLMPAYWAILALAAFIVLSFPEASAQTNPVMRNPGEWQVAGLPLGWLPQITMVGLQLPPGLLFPIRLIPPAWSTAIEVYFYAALVLAALVPDRHFAKVVIVALILGLVCAMTGQARWTYTALPGVAVLFAAGSWAYRNRPFLEQFAARLPLLPSSAFAVYLAVAFAPEFFPALRVESYLVWGQYAVLPAIVVTSWAAVQSKPHLPARLDGWFADLSYPVFLSHFPVAALVRAAGFEGAGLLLVSIVATLGVSALVVLGVEKPVKSLRARIRRTPPAPT